MQIIHDPQPPVKLVLITLHFRGGGGEVGEREEDELRGTIAQ